MLTDGVKYKGASSFGNKTMRVFMSGAEVQILRGNCWRLSWDDTGAICLGRHDCTARRKTVGKAFFSVMTNQTITTSSVPERSCHTLSVIGICNIIFFLCRRKKMSLDVRRSAEDTLRPGRTTHHGPLSCSYSRSLNGGEYLWRKKAAGQASHDEGMDVCAEEMCDARSLWSQHCHSVTASSRAPRKVERTCFRPPWEGPKVRTEASMILNFLAVHKILLGRASFTEQLQAPGRLASSSHGRATFHLPSSVPVIPAFNVLLFSLLHLESMLDIDEGRGGMPLQIFRHMAQKSLEWRS